MGGLLMVYLLLGLIIVFLFVLSFGVGYVVGKGYVQIPKKLTDEEKERIAKQEKEFAEMREEYNRIVNQIYGVNFNEWS